VVSTSLTFMAWRIGLAWWRFAGRLEDHLPAS
jgi:hypothetical protein